jgi:hypothetical protein
MGKRKNGRVKHLVVNGKTVVCGLCGCGGAYTRRVKGNHIATCVGCGCSTVGCATPARALLAFVQAMASLGA